MLRIKDINDQIDKMQKLIPFDPDEAYIETVNTDTSGAIRVKVMLKKDGLWITMETCGGGLMDDSI